MKAERSRRQRSAPRNQAASWVSLGINAAHLRLDPSLHIGHELIGSAALTRDGLTNGDIDDAWAQQNAARYGFTVQTYDTQPDAVQAVVSGRAYANLGGNTVVRYAATRAPQFVPDFVIRETRAHWSAPLPMQATQLRVQLENALECMKRDGTMARISQQWFGDAPAADDAERTVFPGTGVPGLPGYDPTPREPRC